jgi:hypothetical protein
VIAKLIPVGFLPGHRQLFTEDRLSPKVKLKCCFPMPDLSCSELLTRTLPNRRILPFAGFELQDHCRGPYGLRRAASRAWRIVSRVRSVSNMESA